MATCASLTRASFSGSRTTRLSLLVTYSRLAMPSAPLDGTTPGLPIRFAHQRTCAILFFIVPSERPWRFHSLTSATLCLRFSPVDRRPLKPRSCRVSAICASA